MNDPSQDESTSDYPQDDLPNENTQTNRRDFLSVSSSVAMGGGLLLSYGTLGIMAGRFLYPSQEQELAWVFVTDVDDMQPGDVLNFQTPAGRTVTVTRRGNNGKAEDFLALSTVCPHLGCQVHWESQNNRFFCPCHNGAFDSSGKATEGPPAQANQSLPTYPIRVDKGMIFIQAPAQSS